MIDTYHRKLAIYIRVDRNLDLRANGSFLFPLTRNDAGMRRPRLATLWGAEKVEPKHWHACALTSCAKVDIGSSRRDLESHASFLTSNQMFGPYIWNWCQLLESCWMEWKRENTGSLDSTASYNLLVFRVVEKCIVRVS